MSKAVLKVEDLSKRYQLGTIGYGSLQKDLASWWARLRGSEDPNALVGGGRPYRTGLEFWALQGLNFEIEAGERLGIIGRNGAGKSTLLKVISRITAPTTGRVAIRGRVTSLLEVGTGFHAELTGRENVFLNGAILGMRRREIQSRFDEIVSFAGVDQFIDTPVKRYSSGMYVRLAFSVAAHLDSEILIVDEVLAVGDADFQRKSLGKLDGMARTEGKTVLLVSHQLNTISRVCNKGILLDHGHQIMGPSPISDIVAKYNADNASPENVWRKSATLGAEEYLTPVYLEVAAKNDAREGGSVVLRGDESPQIKIGILVHDPHHKYSVGICISTMEGVTVFWSYTTDQPRENWPKISKGYNEYLVGLPPRFLNEGDYRVELITSIHNKLWITEPSVSAPWVRLTIRGGLSDSEYWQERRPGVAAPVLTWKHSESQSWAPS